MPNQLQNEKETIIIQLHIAGSLNIVGQGIGSNEGVCSQHLGLEVQAQIRLLTEQVTLLQCRVKRLETIIKSAQLSGNISINFYACGGFYLIKKVPMFLKLGSSLMILN